VSQDTAETLYQSVTGLHFPPLPTKCILFMAPDSDFLTTRSPLHSIPNSSYLCKNKIQDLALAYEALPDAALPLPPAYSLPLCFKTHWSPPASPTGQMPSYPRDFACDASSSWLPPSCHLGLVPMSLLRVSFPTAYFSS
jgi:hypothetical protein